MLCTWTFQGCHGGHQLVAQCNPRALPRVRVACRSHQWRATHSLCSTNTMVHKSSLWENPDSEGNAGPVAYSGARAQSALWVPSTSDFVIRSRHPLGQL